MNHSLKKSLLSAAVAAALVGGAGHALAINSILFDADGSGGGAEVKINQFTWDQIMVLAKNAFNNNTTQALTSGTALVTGQGRLQSYSPDTGPAVGNASFTFVFSVDLVNVVKDGTGAGAKATLATDPGAAPGSTPTLTNYFSIYSNSVSNSSLAAGTGCFSCGSLILSGSVFVDNAINSTGPADAAGGTVLSAQLTGTATTSIGGAGLTTLGGKPVVTRAATSATNTVGLVVNVDGATVDTNYFKSDISSFQIDLDFQSSLVDPFNSTTYLQATVAGLTPILDLAGGATVLNDFACGAPGICDMIWSSNSGASTFFHNAAPEPGSLALLGLGLAGLGAYTRRRKQRS